MVVSKWWRYFTVTKSTPLDLLCNMESTVHIVILLQHKMCMSKGIWEQLKKYIFLTVFQGRII